MLPELKILPKAEPDGQPQSFRFRIFQPDFIVIHFPVALSDNIVALYRYHAITEWQRMPRFLSKSERSRGFVFFKTNMERRVIRQWVLRSNTING